MLATILVWVYISFLCWTWGVLFLFITRKLTRDQMVLPHFSIICITGLSVITIVAAALSLIIPLGGWWVQFFFIVPGVSVFFIKNTPYFFSSVKKEFSLLHITSLILLLCLLVLIAVMSSWKIVHPDTLGYHAQTIQWIEKYKAVPGLVHLHVRFGYQGLWFVDSALFDFSFTGKQGITYLNSSVLFWFLLFIVNRVDHNFFKDGKRMAALLWLGLLSLSLWSYTQVRLTATSASPDFIATIFVLAIFYLLLSKETKHLHAIDWLPPAMLSIVAVTLKLSAAPILIIAFVALLLFAITKRIKSFVALLFIAVVTFSVFIARNIITTGYVIFPSTILDISNVDWKYSRELTANEMNYITAYAKKQGVATKEEIDLVNNMNVSEWLPAWWQNRSIADKTIVVLFLFSIVAGLIFNKRVIHLGFLPLLVIGTMLAGIIFWFINAPDPRFGFGFILGFISVMAWLLLKEKEISISVKALIIILISFSSIIAIYTAYRFINFFQADQLVAPIGIPSSAYKTFDCDGIMFNVTVNGEFGTTPVPCTDMDCSHYSPIGNKIEDGFRARQNP